MTYDTSVALEFDEEIFLSSCIDPCRAIRVFEHHYRAGKTQAKTQVRCQPYGVLDVPYFVSRSLWLLVLLLSSVALHLHGKRLTAILKMIE